MTCECGHERDEHFEDEDCGAVIDRTSDTPDGTVNDE
jgi:hypothetical protein